MVYYEDILLEAHRQSVFQGVQKFMGVEPTKLQSKLVKVTKDHFLGSYLTNYEEVREVVAPYELFRAMLQDQLLAP
eukprot:scaffold4470_cov255-Prasinococcus_capsulatus_cf.AAC.20